MADIAKELEKIAENLGIDRKKSIGQVAEDLKVKPHVIRFWEENFPQIKPEIGAGGRRYYYNKQLKILRRIKKFLYEDGYTIAGLRKLLSKKNKDEFILEKAADLQVIINESVKEREIEIDDFLPKEIDNIKILKNTNLLKDEIVLPGIKIEAKAKLLDFAEVEVSEIDGLRFRINKKLQEVRKKLMQLKVLN